MKKVVLLVTLAAMMIVAFAGCGQAAPSESAESSAPAATEAPSVEATEAPTEAPSAEPVVLKAAGSTSVGPVLEALVELYIAENPNVSIDVEQIDSGAGVTAAGDGTADIGMASRNLKDEEKTTYPDMQSTILCVDGVAVVVSAENSVKELTKDQIKGIFTGEITDWSEVGGDKGKITLYSRESTSGTREAFQTLFLGKDDKGEQIEIDDTMCVIQESNGAIGTAIEGDKTGIGYMSLGIAPSYKVTSITVDGVEATVEKLVAGEYTYSRPFNLLTMGAPAGDVATFIEWCTTSDEAISYMEEKGYVMP